MLKRPNCEKGTSRGCNGKNEICWGKALRLIGGVARPHHIHGRKNIAADQLRIIPLHVNDFFAAKSGNTATDHQNVAAAVVAAGKARGEGFWLAVVRALAGVKRRFAGQTAVKEERGSRGINDHGHGHVFVYVNELRVPGNGEVWAGAVAPPIIAGRTKEEIIG